MPCRSQFGSLPAQPGAEARHLMLLSATLGRWSRTGTENGTRLPRSALCHHDPTHVKGMTPQGLPVPPPHACCPCQGFSGVGQGVRAAVVFPRAEQPLPLHHRGSRLAVHSNIAPSDGNGRRNTASGLWLSNHAVKQGGKKKKNHSMCNCTGLYLLHCSQGIPPCPHSHSDGKPASISLPLPLHFPATAAFLRCTEKPLCTHRCL